MYELNKTIIIVILYVILTEKFGYVINKIKFNVRYHHITSYIYYIVSNV